jgi:hypothetical protein
LYLHSGNNPIWGFATFYCAAHRVDVQLKLDNLNNVQYNEIERCSRRINA